MNSKPRILFLHRQQSAVGYYRTWLPARHLHAKGYPVKWWEEGPARRRLGQTPEKRGKWLQEHIKSFDLIYCDRALDQEELGELMGFRHYIDNCRMIMDFDDDFTNVPWWNLGHNSYQPGQLNFDTGMMHLRASEMTTVSTPHLVKHFKKHAHQIRLAENCIDPADWADLAVCPERESDNHLRVLYGGASGHYGDLDDVKEGIEATLRNPPVPFRLICFGALPTWMHELSREFPGRLVSLPWVNFNDYPQAIAWGGFDISLAPLADHIFNQSKSNIKYLEAAVQGIPFMCSDIGPYSSIPDDCAVKVENTPARWAASLRNLLQYPDLREELKKKARADVLANWTIDKRGKQWEDIVLEATSLPRIMSLEDTKLSS